MPILLVEWSAQISEVIDKDLSDSTTSAYSIVYIELDAAFIIQTMFNFFLKSEVNLSRYTNWHIVPLPTYFLTTKAIKSFLKSRCMDEVHEDAVVSYWAI